MSEPIEYTIEGSALDHYTNWWEAAEEGSKYDSRYEKLTAAMGDHEASEVWRLIREAHAEAFKAGFMLRLTGE